MMILDDFFWRAVIAGMGVAILAGPLGCFVIWRRMSYLGDTMAHSALLGVAVGVFLEVNLILGVFAVAIAVALLLFLFQQQKQLANDAVLGTLSHASLAMGVLAISLMSWVHVDLMGYLFGDILAVDLLDVELHDYGWQAIVPGFGFLSERFPDAKLTVHKINTSTGTATFNDKVQLELKPFPGVMGVAPATDEMLSTIPPRANGGNMDDPNLTKGTTVYFPIFVKGALKSAEWGIGKGPGLFSALDVLGIQK